MKRDDWTLFTKDGVIYFHCQKAAEQYAKQVNKEMIIKDFNTIRYYGVVVDENSS